MNEESHFIKFKLRLLDDVNNKLANFFSSYCSPANTYLVMNTTLKVADKTFIGCLNLNSCYYIYSNYIRPILTKNKIVFLNKQDEPPLTTVLQKNILMQKIYKKIIRVIIERFYFTDVQISKRFLCTTN